MSLLNSVRPGDRVTIVDRFGKRRTGKAVMKGTYGWVLNMGGAHGTPGIADDDNVVDVRSSTGKAKYTGSNPDLSSDKYDGPNVYFHDFDNHRYPSITMIAHEVTPSGKRGTKFHQYRIKKKGKYENYTKAQLIRACLDGFNKTLPKPSRGNRWGKAYIQHDFTRETSSNPSAFVIIQGARKIRFATLEAARKAANEYQRRTGKFVNISREDKKSNPLGDHIVYERGWNVVVKQDDRYLVLRHTSTHAVTDSAYPNLSLAKARVDYLFKTHGDKPFSNLKNNPGNRSGKWITISVADATQRAKQSGVKLPKPGESVYLKWPFKYTLHRDSYGYYIDSPELKSNPRRRKISRRRRAKSTRKNPRPRFGRYKKMKRGVRGKAYRARVAGLRRYHAARRKSGKKMTGKHKSYRRRK